MRIQLVEDEMTLAETIRRRLTNDFVVTNTVPVARTIADSLGAGVTECEAARTAAGGGPTARVGVA